MQALIDFLIRNLLAFWPIARVYSWQQGVRIWCGKLGKELEPGIHWRTPFFEEIYKVNAAQKTIDLKVGTVTTMDRKPIIVSANITYRVRSVRDLWQNVDSSVDSLRDVALGFLSGECSNQTWDSLLTNRTVLQDQLAEHMSGEVRPWGIEVLHVYVTDLAQVKPYRFLGSAET